MAMRKYVLNLILTGIALLIIASPYLAVYGKEPITQADLRLKVLSATSAREKGNAYKLLFTAAGSAGIREMCNDKDVGISLQSAWEHYTKVVKRPMPIPNRSEMVFDRESVIKFLKFAAERLDVSPPTWWREAMLNGDVFPGRHHAFLHNAMPQLTLSKEAGMYIPESVHLTILRDEAIMTTKDKTVRFSAFLIGNEQATLFTTTLAEDYWYIARYSEKGYPFSVTCVRRNDGKVAWTADVWAVRRGGSTGVGSHRVEILERKSSVLVFGRESHGMYVEGFDKNTGKSHFRFCTSYWSSPSEGWGMK